MAGRLQFVGTLLVKVVLLTLVRCSGSIQLCRENTSAKNNTVFYPEISAPFQIHFCVSSCDNVSEYLHIFATQQKRLSYDWLSTVIQRGRVSSRVSKDAHTDTQTWVTVTFHGVDERNVGIEYNIRVYCHVGGIFQSSVTFTFRIERAGVTAGVGVSDRGGHGSKVIRLNVGIVVGGIVGFLGVVGLLIAIVAVAMAMRRYSFRRKRTVLHVYNIPNQSINNDDHAYTTFAGDSHTSEVQFPRCELAMTEDGYLQPMAVLNSTDNGYFYPLNEEFQVYSQTEENDVTTRSDVTGFDEDGYIQPLDSDFFNDHVKSEQTESKDYIGPINNEHIQIARGHKPS